MNKALIIPVLALFALIIKQGFGYTIPQDALDVIANGILSIVTLVGIFMHPVKQGAESDAGKTGE
jgi:uncharacterized membrane protein